MNNAQVDVGVKGVNLEINFVTVSSNSTFLVNLGGYGWGSSNTVGQSKVMKKIGPV